MRADRQFAGQSVRGYKRAKTEFPVRLKKHEKRKAHRIGRDGSGKQIKAAAVCNLGLEGIVSERLTSIYKSGPSKAWIKVKNPKSPARVIDGFEKKSFRHEA